MPFRSSSENATVAATELIHALKNPAPAAPFTTVGDKQMEALNQLATIFKQSVDISSPPNVIETSVITPKQKSLVETSPRVVIDSVTTPMTLINNTPPAQSLRP